MRTAELAITRHLAAQARSALAALSTLAAASGLSACDRGGGPVTSCQDSLTGTWVRERGSSERPRPEAVGPELPERWAILDHGPRLEIYPLFDDTAAYAAEDAKQLLVRSPRSLELLRSHSALLGHVERWVMRRGTKCLLRGSARLSGCRSDDRGAVLDAQLVELPMPFSDEDLAACWPGPRVLPRQAQRWRRVE